MKYSLIGICGLAVLATAQGATAGVELLSHRAVYNLSLADSDPGLAVTGVDGGLVMEWKRDCAGWISNQRIGFSVRNADGPDLFTDVSFSSWESADGTELKFNVRSFDALGLVEETRGRAALEHANGPGVVHFSQPEESMLELPAGTVFPSGHMQRLIGAARRGDLIVSVPVFDGSGPDSLMKVTGVIGRLTPGVAPATGAEESRWPVSLAYHDLEDGETLPEFEISFELGDTGVLYDLVLDYGDIALKAELDRIEVLERPDCP